MLATVLVASFLTLVLAAVAAAAGVASFLAQAKFARSLSALRQDVHGVNARLERVIQILPQLRQ